MKAAAVDIGTNSVKMVIGWKDGDAIIVREAVPIITRLGKNTDATGQLDPVATERTLAALRHFREQASAEGVSLLRAVGTAALRDAVNGAEFLNRAEAILGGPVEVISGDREAELVYQAARSDARRLAPEASVIATTDVGGGSTEVVIGEGERPHFRRSLQIGAVRLTERALLSDPPSPSDRQAAVDLIEAILADVPMPFEPPVLIASGGTAASLGAMHLAEENPDFLRAVGATDFPERLHGVCLTAGEIERRIERLCELPLAERRTVPGLEPERADVIIAGALIQWRLLRHLGIDSLFVSAHGLRYGLLSTLLGDGNGGPTR
ncbi:MAG: Ppx/GppA phosphatase family protein [Capsulimonadales bacterium]|nr:Ppx/GppA phosphatase family protein [Capsulimonadales bacterium]